MLTSLGIRDFAIVGELEVTLGAGLTVLTGETGAGKSIIIDALDLALGGRADTAAIRAGARRAEITATFTLDPESDAAAWLRARDLDADGECILRRTVSTERGSRAWINGTAVAVQQLRELGDLLVDIHGQHEHQSLLRRDAQRQLLDDYADAGELLGTLAARYRELRELERRRDELARGADDLEGRLDLLRHQVRELEALELQPGEPAELEQEHHRLAHASDLAEGIQAALALLYEGADLPASESLGTALERLRELVEYDPALAGAIEVLEEAQVRVDDAARQLQHAAGNIEIDPGRLQWVDRRVDAITGLARKHRVAPQELPARLDELGAELSELEDAAADSGKLATALRAAHAAWADQATQLSTRRADAAARLAREVSEQLPHLGLAGAKFEVRCEAHGDARPSPAGRDSVEFLVTTNPGQPSRPMSRIASGGELSRISLALQVVTAASGRIPALIFDEVDVGIGGGVAEIVGSRLRELARRRQVLCITHLPQVAAQGDHHLRVTKRGARKVEVDLQWLADKERVEEIARMLGGVKITRQTIAHAEEMLQRGAA